MIKEKSKRWEISLGMVMMRKKIACISIDIEPDLRDPDGRVRFFDDFRLMEQFKGVVDKYYAPVTGFLVTALIEPYGSILKDLHQHLPIEFGVHSHDHNTDNACSKDQIYKAVESFKDFFGMTPGGYRAPNGLISTEGICHLIDYGFQYDSSIFPSIRFDEYGYSNLKYSTEPFLFERSGQYLMEMPLACLKGIRLVVSLSHVKLLGWRFYRMLMALFPLPNVFVLNLHPYDFYIPLISRYINGWKKIAHLRNANNAFQLFDRILKMLREKGYEFMFMSEANRVLRDDQAIKKVPLEQRS